MTLSQATRRLVLPLFRHINAGDVTIRHHWTGYPMRLHSFKHKGYWWHGRKREEETMELFAELVPRGSIVLEVGGHIGYVAQHFSMLTGPEGQVFCFEPSPENLPYLRANAARTAQPNIEIVEAAAGDRDDLVPFFYESITGQNSTTLADFKGLEINSGFNGLPIGYETCKVPMRSLDSFIAERAIRPGFIKIDAEGSEREILQGMSEAMRSHPRIMVEITRNDADVFKLLTQAGYLLFDTLRVQIPLSEPSGSGGNVFAVHSSDQDGLVRMRGSADKH